MAKKQVARAYYDARLKPHRFQWRVDIEGEEPIMNLAEHVAKRIATALNAYRERKL